MAQLLYTLLNKHIKKQKSKQNAMLNANKFFGTEKKKNMNK